MREVTLLTVEEFFWSFFFKEKNNINRMRGLEHKERLAARLAVAEK